MKKIQQNSFSKQFSENQPIRDSLLLKTNIPDDGTIDIQLRKISKLSKLQHFQIQVPTSPSNIHQQNKFQTNKQQISQVKMNKDKQVNRRKKLKNHQSITNRQNLSYDPNYDIWDLTFTMISSQVPALISTIFFIIFLIIRYYTFVCIIYVVTKYPVCTACWILIIVISRVLYMILVIKISLKAPQTKTQIVLKTNWNSKQSQINQLFETIDRKKLMTSIIRGLIPPEFSFLYIQAPPSRRLEIYVAINYINSSIQAILYYPFFILEVFYLDDYDQMFQKFHFQKITIILAIIDEFIILIISLVLIIMGVQRKYGSIFCCFSS